MFVSKEVGLQSSVNLKSKSPTTKMCVNTPLPYVTHQKVKAGVFKYLN